VLVLVLELDEVVEGSLWVPLAAFCLFVPALGVLVGALGVKIARDIPPAKNPAAAEAPKPSNRCRSCPSPWAVIAAAKGDTAASSLSSNGISYVHSAHAPHYLSRGHICQYMPIYLHIHVRIFSCMYK